MANPGKTYDLPCHLSLEYVGYEDMLAMVDFIKIGRRKYQINAYSIEV